MKKVRFESASSIGHFELPDDAVILDNDNEDDVIEDDAMYPAGLKMEGDEDENGRDIRDDNDNSSPLDREEGMFPAGVK